MAQFVQEAVTPNNDLLPGVRVRVLTEAGTDVTALLLGIDPAITNANGAVSNTFPDPGPLAPGTYTIQLTAPGYKPLSFPSSDNWQGAGYFHSFMEVAETGEDGEFTITAPTQFRSAYAPIPYTVILPPFEGWQLLQTSIVRGGKTSLMESPVDEISREAYADIRNRVRLAVQPHFVPDGTELIIDPDFSDSALVSFASLTDALTIPIEADQEAVHVANIYPIGKTGDLTELTHLGTSGKAKWLTPFAHLIHFLGYYMDVMLWIPFAGADGEPLGLHFEEYNAAGTIAHNTIYTLLGDQLDTGKVLRVRLPQPTSELTQTSKLYITRDDVAITETLNVTYL